MEPAGPRLTSSGGARPDALALPRTEKPHTAGRLRNHPMNPVYFPPLLCNREPWP
jgi:hypothetical protein